MKKKKKNRTQTEPDSRYRKVEPKPKPNLSVTETEPKPNRIQKIFYWNPNRIERFSIDNFSNRNRILFISGAICQP